VALSEAQMNELLKGTRDRVFRWALVITRDRDDAEDVAQQVSLAVHRKYEQFESRSAFSTWLYSVVRNASYDIMRKAARRRELSLDDLTLEPISDESLDQIAMISDRRTADLVKAFFAELPARQRELVQLVDIEGYSAADAARMLGIEAETARVHVLRGRRALRAKMLAAHPELFT
jgi:RNA polymerase sigma-70 factor (ECF subfamily)